MDQKELSVLLAEQHRNTRHDAIDIVNDVRNKWQDEKNYKFPDAMFNEIMGQIMNLKIRNPQ